MQINGHVNGTHVNGFAANSESLYLDYTIAADEAVTKQREAWALASRLKALGVNVESYGADAPELEIVSARDLLRSELCQSEIVIDGILRRGEIANLIASPKMGKTWIVLGMAVCVANGRDWLGRKTKKGRVLLIDNELPLSEIKHRLDRVSKAMGLPVDGIDIISLRGKQKDLPTLEAMTAAGKGLPVGQYDLIVIDALYRCLPAKTNENDNGQMIAIYNTVDSLAAKTKSAILLVHHSSKGDQSSKSLTDMGSGAGTISRAADAHLAIRPHAIANAAVLEGVTRSFASPEPQTIVFRFPVWEASLIEPELLQPKTPGAMKQERQDAETFAAILKAISESSTKLTAPQIRRKTGFGDSRTQRGLAKLIDCGKVTRRTLKNRDTKKTKVTYALKDE